MTSYCNYDSSSNYTVRNQSSFWRSDCYYDCINNGCNQALLGNAKCDESCNIAQCGYDLGDCGYCSPGCNSYLGFNYMVGSVCYPKCNTTACYYDMGICAECSPGCLTEYLGNGKCDDECNTGSCNYDFGDCPWEECSSGCYTWYINDGTCQDACYNSDCNWDGSDCDCAPGCNSTLKQNNVCDKACNNTQCDFDNYVCGSCAAGCFDSMIGDGNCDPACDVEACNYDLTDCRCSESCDMSMYGTCNEKCMVGSCLYDQYSNDPSKRCSNTLNILFYMHLQLLKYDLYTVQSIESCELLCYDYAEYLLKEETCYSSCNNINCIYSWCECPDQEYMRCFDSNCKKCYGENEGQCFECDFSKGNVAQFFGYCLESCPSGYFNYNVTGVYPLCLPSTDYSTKDNPTIYYVTSIQTNDTLGGIGTKESPFISLALALASISTKYSIVYLLNDGDHYLEQLNSKYPIALTTDDPTKADCSHNVRKNLVVTTQNNEIVYLKPKIDQPILTITLSHTELLSISNVIFDGNYWIHGENKCLDESCAYCPSVTEKYDYTYIDDRSVQIINYTNQTHCKEFWYWNLFEVADDTSLILSNVQFINWRLQENSLIQSTGGNVYLSSVYFDNIQTAPLNNSAVIVYLSCSSDTSYDCGEFYYEKGSVTRLNNGYEFSSSLDFRGFFTAFKVKCINFTNVEFKNNAVYSASFNIASLIYAEVYRQFNIQSCVFEYNYASTGLIFLFPVKLVLSTEINEENQLTDYLINHIQISESNFTNNFGVSAGIFSAYFIAELQNIYFEKLIIENNGASSGYLVYIWNNFLKSSYMTETTAIVQTLDKRVTATQSPRSFQWTNVTFSNNFFTSGAFYLYQLVLVKIYNLEMNSNGGNSNLAGNLNDILINYWVGDGELYIKNKVDSSDFYCTALATWQGVYFPSIKYSIIQNNYCENSTPAWNFIDTAKMSIEDSTFFSNVGISESNPTVLLIGGTEYNADLSNVAFINNKNSYSSGYGTVYGCGTVLIMNVRNCIFTSNYSPGGGAIMFIGAYLVTDSSTFELNSSPNDGGSIYLRQTSLTFAKAWILNCTFHNNSADDGNGYGGAIYMENSGSSSNLFTINVDISNFTQNFANRGSAIYIAESMRLIGTSGIANCKFESNTASGSGALAVLYKSGKLDIYETTFIENIGRLGAAIYAEHGESSKAYSSILYISSSTFNSSQGISVINLANSDVFSYIYTKNCLFSNNNATVLILDYDHWADEDSILVNNTGRLSGGVKMVDNSYVNCSNTVFKENHSYSNGGAISAGTSSAFHCYECTFLKNKASGSGGAIYIEQNSLINISYSSFTSNQCSDKGSAIYLLGASTPRSTILSSIFTENYSKNQAVIALLASDIFISFSTFNGNQAVTITPGILLTLSNATIINSEFINHNGQEGSFLYATTQSIVEISSSSFVNGISDNSAGAIYSISSNIAITNSYFEENHAKNGGGGAIMSYSSSSLQITNCVFKNSFSSDLGGVIWCYESDLSIFGSHLDTFSTGAISASKMYSVVISSSTFKNGNATYGGALFCSQCSLVDISDTLFANNYAYQGGAIYLTTSADTSIGNAYTITNSYFKNNLASLGGAIYTDNISLNVSFTYFSQNNATALLESSSGIIPSQGCGGAIHVACKDFDDCAFNILKSTFCKNTATYNGGAINWVNIMPIDDSDIFIDNSATYGNDISSFAIKLAASSLNGSLEFSNRRLDDDLETVLLENIAPGQVTTSPILLALIDPYGSIVSTDSVSVAELSASDTATTTLSGATKVAAVQGLYYFDSFVVSAKPGSNISIVVSTDGIDTTKIKKASMNLTAVPTINVTIALRECEIGEITLTTSCQICPNGSYSLDPTNDHCSSCSDSMHCYGGALIAPKPGYWRSNNHTDKVWECPKSSSCLGSPPYPNISYSGLCCEGYEGNLCQACSVGYSRTSTNTCAACPDPVLNSLRIIGIMIGAIAICTIMVSTTRSSAYKPKSMESVYIKIFVNYLQIIMLTSTFDLSWPESVAELLRIQATAGSVSSQVFSFDCFLDSGQGQTQIYFNKLIIMSVVPIIMILGTILFWGIYAMLKQSMPSFKNDIISTYVILFFMIHPNLIKMMFGALSCKQIEAGEYWLVNDLDIKCWDDNHLFYVFCVVIPSILVWGIGIPAISLYFIWRMRKKLESISARLRFGFLFNGYRRKCYYWEFVILYRKLLICTISVFLGNISQDIQALTVMVLLMVCLYIQNENKPYIGGVLNKMEFRAILVASITIYCGLYYLTGVLDESSKFVLFLIIVLANIYFLYYWLCKMFSAGFRKAVTLIPWLKHKLSQSTDGFDDDLFERPGSNHVTRRWGKKMFSVIPTDDGMPVESIDAEGYEIVSLDMKAVFKRVLKNDIDKKKLNCSTIMEENEDISYAHITQ